MGSAFPTLDHPIIQAPMAGGPSTPALAAAVSNAGGLGFVAGGYRTAAQLEADIVATSAVTEASFGVNLFCLPPLDADADALAEYSRHLEAEASRYGVELGTPHPDDDDLDAKLELLHRLRPPVVSFTFGCPAKRVCDALHRDGSAVWVTVTEPEDARVAAAAGADALICQGVEAGGHRGGLDDADGHGELGLLALLRLTAQISDLPLIASGGLGDRQAVAAALSAGARAAQLGTAFLLCPEAGTSAPHRAALRARGGSTALTRAFSGRRGRGIVNQFMRAHDAHAPAAYPAVNQITSPLRAAARASGDAETINLWAGQAYQSCAERPAAEVVAQLSP